MWKARQLSLDRPVAVKIDERVLDTLGAQHRFLAEARAAGNLSGHPGIVTVHDAGILPDERPYLVMELCPGGSLTPWLKPENRPSQEGVRHVGVRIGHALAAAHDRGVIHRDVKPANILIDRYGEAGLADFGLVAIPEPDPARPDGLGALTPTYAPLESLRLQDPGMPGDVYQLAATLYALLSGHAPHGSDRPTPSLSDLIEEHAQPVEPLPGVDGDLMRVIISGLSSDPVARPTAAQFRDQLSAIDLAHPAPASPAPASPAPASPAPASLGPPPADGPISDGPTSDGSRTTGPVRKKRRLGLTIALVSVIAVLALVFGSAGFYLYEIDRSVTANISRGIELPADSARPGKVAGAETALNYVLIGTDEGNPKLDEGGRSDSIMVVHLNQAHDEAEIISFPRDLWVTVPGHGKSKINAAYELGGPALVVSTLENLTGTRMDHVAIIDFEGFVQLTDDLDGVTLENRNTFESHGFSYPKGRITLSGDRALWFVRENEALPSELDRAENQRRMLKAILTKGLSAEVVVDPIRFTTFVGNAAKRIAVDNLLTDTEIRSTLLSLRLRPSNLTMMQAPIAKAGRAHGQSVHRVDEAQMVELGHAMAEDKMAGYRDKYPNG